MLFTKLRCLQMTPVVQSKGGGYICLWGRKIGAKVLGGCCSGTTCSICSTEGAVRLWAHHSHILLCQWALVLMWENWCEEVYFFPKTPPLCVSWIIQLHKAFLSDAKLWVGSDTPNIPHLFGFLCSRAQNFFRDFDRRLFAKFSISSPTSSWFF